MVIAGFEPLDVMQAILMLVRQINQGRAEVENEYIRAVTREGNAKAQEIVAEVFELRDTFEWRGLGACPFSALQDARRSTPRSTRRGASSIDTIAAPDNPACECGAILRGEKKAGRLQIVRDGMHARQSDGVVHGVVGRLLRRPLDLWAVPELEERKASLMNAPRLRTRKLDCEERAGRSFAMARAAGPWRN